MVVQFVKSRFEIIVNDTKTQMIKIAVNVIFQTRSIDIL